MLIILPAIATLCWYIYRNSEVDGALSFAQELGATTSEL
jgi:hypothetical protein